MFASGVEVSNFRQVKPVQMAFESQYGQQPLAATYEYTSQPILDSTASVQGECVEMRRRKHPASMTFYKATCDCCNCYDPNTVWKRSSLHKCSLCGKQFRWPRSLKMHRKTHDMWRQSKGVSRTDGLPHRNKIWGNNIDILALNGKRNL